MSWVTLKSVPFCVCVLSRDKSSKKYKSLGRYSQFTVCSMCSKSLRSYVYTHSPFKQQDRQNRTNYHTPPLHVAIHQRHVVLHSHGTETRLPEKGGSGTEGGGTVTESKDWQMVAILLWKKIRKSLRKFQEKIDKGRCVDFALPSRQLVMLNSCLEEALVSILAL